MKKVVIIKEEKEYISNLVKKNNWKCFHCDDFGIAALFVLSSSKNLEGEEKLLIFNTSLRKLTVEIVDIIKNTKHHVLIIAEDEKKIPAGLKTVCEKEVVDASVTPNIMNTLGKLGSSTLSLDEIKEFPLGQLIKYLNVNWQKFERGREVYDILLEINKRLYKVGEDYLYLYLLYGFPVQNRKTFFRYPSRKKVDMKDSILKKIGDYYGYSIKETTKMWWLIKKILNSELADKYKLTNEEMKLLGIKKIEQKVTKEVNIPKVNRSKSLLDI